MASNNFEVTQLVANLALAEFVSNNSCLMTAHRGYQSDFKTDEYAKGDTINIRRQNHFTVNKTRVASIQPINEEVVPLTISEEYNVSFEYTTKELTLDVDPNLDRFSDRYIRPSVQAMTKEMEVKIMQSATPAIYFATGSAASTLNSFASIDLAGAKMLEQEMDILDSAYGALSIRDGSALKSSLQNSFNPILNDDISFGSQLGRLSYFDLFQNQSVQTHTTGSLIGTPLVDGEVVSGNTINMKGFTATQSNVLRLGDIISIAGVFSVDPISRFNTGQLMQFVVQADVDSDGAGDAVVTVSPSIITDFANARRNVTNTLPDNGAVTLFGQTVADTPVTYRENLFYSPRALDVVVPPLECLDGMRCFNVTDKDANVSIRVSRDGDIVNSVNMIRLDIIWGLKWHPQYAIKVISQVTAA